MAILAVTAVSYSADAVDVPLDDQEHPANQKVAEFNGENYTIADAIQAANGSGKPITLTADYNWQITIPYGNVVTIDLNGFDVYPHDSGNPFFNHGTLTLTSTGKDVSVIGGEYTEAAISNSGALTILPDAASGGIKIHGSVNNDNYEEYDGYEQYINIHDGVSIIGQGVLPALGSIKDGSSINIYGGSITHTDKSVLIDLTDGSLNIFGGILKGSDYQPVLTTSSYNNDVVIGTTDSNGPTISGKTNGDYGLFFDELFELRDNSGAIIMYSGTVTQLGNGMLFRCDLDLRGGELVRHVPDEMYPMVHAHSGLWIGTSIEGNCKAPLVQSDGEVFLNENGSVTQNGSGYAIECWGLTAPAGTVQAVGDAILSHGHIEINGDGTKPVITSDTGYCFVAKDGSFDGGVYKHHVDANVVRLEVSPGHDTEICFENACIVNGFSITTFEGPMVDAEGIDATEYRYALETDGVRTDMSLYVFDTGDSRCSVTRQSNDSAFTALYASMVNNTKALFDNLDAVAAAFPDADEDIWRMVNLLADVENAHLTIPSSISINLASFSIESLSVPFGSNITVLGNGFISSVTNNGYLKIREGTFGNISSDVTATLEVSGGSFSSIPQGAIVPDDLSFVRDAEGMWVLQKVPVIDVDGNQYYSYKEAERNIKNGSIVTLLMDGFKPLTIGNGEDPLRNVTIDLNGHYIDCFNTESITINKWVVATMIDDDPSDIGSMIMNAGNLTITGGRFAMAVNYGLGESNVLNIKGGEFTGYGDGDNIMPALMIGDPEGASTVRITGGEFHSNVVSWDVFPNDNRTPKVYIGGGLFRGDFIGMMDDSNPTIIDPADAGFMVSGGTFVSVPESIVQAGYVIEQRDGMRIVILEPTAQTSTVTINDDYADKEVILELPNQTIVSTGGNLVIPELEDGFQNMTVEVDGQKFTTVVEVSGGVIVNDVDMTIPKGTSTVNSQKLETDVNLSKTVVANINTVFDDLEGDELEVEVSLSIPEQASTNQIVSQSGGEVSISIDININTVTDNRADTLSETSSLLEFIIPIPENDLGKALQVYRDHEGEISALPELDSKDNVTTEGYLVEDGYIHIFAQKFSTYTAVTTGEAAEDDDTTVPPWIWDDDDEYIPPLVPTQPADEGPSNDNTTKIVACAAAAVVAALMAAYLIIDRRH